MLTHEDATWTEQLPYMAARCAPVQVVECFGRAARRSPPCATEHCVFNWWKERDPPESTKHCAFDWWKDLEVSGLVAGAFGGV